MLELVEATIRRENLIEKGDGIILALSGGADSVALFHVLLSLKDKYRLDLYCAHFNHQIRGMDAQADALFASSLCEEHGITCFIRSEDIPAIAKERKSGIEETARLIRYRMLFELKDKLGLQKIAVAHNLDDQAETILMRMMRGTGLFGLTGMEYQRADGIIRPLLDIEKKDILRYCKEKEYSYRDDYTNVEEEYTRNRIRLSLIPSIERDFNPNVKHSIVRMGSLLKEDSDYLEKIAQGFYEHIRQSGERRSVCLDLDELQGLEAALSKRVLRLAMRDCSGNIVGIEQRHVEEILRFVQDSQVNKQIHLPNGLFVSKSYDTLCFAKHPMRTPTDKSYDYQVRLNESILVKEAGLVVSTYTLTKEQCVILPTGRYSKAFDYDKIKDKLHIRSRKNGDVMQPMGMSGTKKIKDILIDAKVDTETRETIPLLCDGDEIIWLVGHHMSEAYKIEESTKQVLRVQIKKSNGT